jgi:hypothetical protein
MNPLADEIALVKAFVVPSKQARYAGFVGSPKRRRSFVRELYHFRDFDPAVVVELPSAMQSGGLLEELRRRGAGNTCYIMSAHAKVDGKTELLADAVSRVFAFLDGTIISCVPGRLAYFEGEAPKNRFILHREGR